jgi:predicted  nucleic acid-binding Zn-ribbon protein
VSVPLRFLGLLVVILGLVGATLSVVGIGFVWVARTRWTPKLVHLAGEVQKALAFVEEHLQQAEAAIDGTSQRLATVRESVQSLAKGGPERQKVTAIIETLDEQVFSRFERVRTLVGASQTTARAAEGSLTLVNSLPLVSVFREKAGEALAGKIENAARGLTEVSDRLAQTRAALQTLSDPDADVRELVADVTARIGGIEGKLRETRELLDKYGPTIPETNAKLARLQERIPFWMTIGAIGLSLLLVWLAAAQVSLLVHGWGWSRG